MRNIALPRSAFLQTHDVPVLVRLQQSRHTRSSSPSASPACGRSATRSDARWHCPQQHPPQRGEQQSQQRPSIKRSSSSRSSVVQHVNHWKLHANTCLYIYRARETRRSSNQYSNLFVCSYLVDVLGLVAGHEVDSFATDLVTPQCRVVLQAVTGAVHVDWQVRQITGGVRRLRPNRVKTAQVDGHVRLGYSYRTTELHPPQQYCIRPNSNGIMGVCVDRTEASAAPPPLPPV